MFNRIKKTGGRIKSGIARGLGFDMLSSTGRYMKEVATGIANTAKPEEAESFEQAKKRLGLSETEIQERAKRYSQQFLVFLGISFLALGYSVYVFLQGSWGSGIVAMLMAVLLAVHALRAHFWAFQLKHHKLGCTLEEWWNNKIKSAPQHSMQKYTEEKPRKAASVKSSKGK